MRIAELLPVPGFAVVDGREEVWLRERVGAGVEDEGVVSEEVLVDFGAPGCIYGEESGGREVWVVGFVREAFAVPGAAAGLEVVRYAGRAGDCGCFYDAELEVWWEEGL